MSNGCSVLGDQVIREVGARELRHHTARVIRSVRDGERVVVTRHGEPQAVLLSINDAIEAIVEHELPALAAKADRDLREGRVHALEPPGPHPVWLAEAAAASYDRMNKQDRARLRSALVRCVSSNDSSSGTRSGRRGTGERSSAGSTRVI